MKIAIIGAGAFGTALAIALDDPARQVTLIGRNPALLQTRAVTNLPGVRIPNGITLSHQTTDANDADAVLLATPAQSLATLITDQAQVLAGKPLVACCKGIDLQTLQGPADLIANALPSAMPAVLTGPSFAADIARGLPTALTLACQDAAAGARLQSALSSPTLRLYRTSDVAGAQLGGALKNVMAIACGATIGAGLGDSARAAVMTRGFAEMTTLAEQLGAAPGTLSGLSGLGDLALTCTSDLSRNYRYGRALGDHGPWDPSVTVEGAATAKAAHQIAVQRDLDLPIIQTTAQLVSGAVTVETALADLLSRPLKDE